MALQKVSEDLSFSGLDADVILMADSSENLSINERLRFVYITKTAGSLSSISIIAFVVLATWYSCPDRENRVFFWPGSGILMVAVSLTRFLVVRRLTILRAAREYFHWIANTTIVMNACMAYYTAAIIHAYGFYSITGIILYNFLAVVIIGTAHALATIPIYQAFVVVMGLLPTSLVLLWDGVSLQDRLVALMTFGPAVYLIGLGRNSYHQHRRQFEVDEKLRNQEEIQRQEKDKLRSVLNSLPGFVAVFDKHGAVAEQSASFLKFVDIAELKEAFAKFKASTGEPTTQQLEWMEGGAASSERTVAYAISFERTKFPVNGVIMTGVPMTDLREAQKQLEVQRSKAEYSARLATLGEMAGGVAHEINNPLAMILGHGTQLVREMVVGQQVNERMVTKLLKITKTTDRIAKIVQGLRTFSRPSDADPMVPVALRELISETLDLCQAKFGQAGIDLQIQHVPDLSVVARGAQIGQVLMNLLNNAYDAASESSEKKVGVSFIADDLQLKILVQDSGCGVPEKVAAKIFEPFFTTKPVGQGTGLGLSVSRSIMQEHGGDLSLVANQRPTTFQITLKRATLGHSGNAA